MADNDDSFALFLKEKRDFPACLAFSAACPDCADRNQGELALDHRLLWAQESEAGSSGMHLGSFMHDVLMGDVTVCEKNL